MTSYLQDGGSLSTPLYILMLHLVIACLGGVDPPFWVRKIPPDVIQDAPCNRSKPTIPS